MRKLLIFTPLIIIALWSSIWLNARSKAFQILNSYKSKQIDIKKVTLNNKNIPSISYSNFKISGFPFKFEIKLFDFIENFETLLIHHEDPIIISFRPFSNEIEILQNGSSLVKSIPTSRGFGNKILGKTSYLINLSPSFYLFKRLILKKNVDELINYIKNIKISSGKKQAFDLIGNDLVYDQNSFDIELKPTKDIYYHSIDEFLKNLPSLININLNTDIKYVKQHRLIAPPSIAFGLLPPYQGKISYEFKIYSKEINRNIQSYLNNYIIDIKGNLESKGNENKVRLYNNLLVKNQKLISDNGKNLVQSEITGDVNLKLNLGKDSLKNFSEFISGYININDYEDKSRNHNSYTKKEIKNILKFIDSLKYIKPSRILDIDLNFLINACKTNASVFVKKLDIISENSSMHTNFDCILPENKEPYIKGNLLLKEYEHFIDYWLENNYIYNLYRNNLLQMIDTDLNSNNFNKKVKNIAKNISQKFLKNISNYPYSKSSDLDIEFNITKNLKNFYIGKYSYNNLNDLLLETIKKEVLQIQNFKIIDKKFRIKEKLSNKLLDLLNDELN